jgi:hypothetical protein
LADFRIRVYFFKSCPTGDGCQALAPEKGGSQMGKKDKGKKDKKKDKKAKKAKKAKKKDKK